MKSFLLYFMLLVATSLAAQTSVYQYKIIPLTGSEININDFKNKMVLVVNISSKSERSAQVQELNTLCERFADKGLVVIAVPSDDFSKEQKSDEELAQIYSNLSANFIITKKSKVKGQAACPLYEWLSLKSNNGIMDNEITGDFQKFLIDRKGNIISVFSGRISPLDPLITNSIAF